MKRILIFGAGSYIAQNFISTFDKEFDFTPIYRKGNGLVYDFLNPNTANSFISKLSGNFDGILFCQGLNPSMGAREIAREHFLDMLSVNLVEPAILLQQLHPILNKGSGILLFSSIATKKGSYDPGYASSKSGLKGLIYSLASAYPEFRFNLISLGLVKGSPVEKAMTTDFKEKHYSKMFDKKLIQINNVLGIISECIVNQNLHLSEISLDGGYK